MIINDIVPSVVSKIRQRTELAAYCPYYIAQSILDLSINIEIDDLKQTGPLTNFVENLAEYPIVGYDPLGVNGNPFIQSTDDGLATICSWFVYFDTSGVITPGQSTGKEIDKRDLRVVEPMSKILGIPSVYTIHGTSKNKGKIIVGQMPDNPYACQLRYQRQHPFTIPYGNLMQANADTSMAAKLAQSFVYMPDDWTEIITLAAAEKMCDDFGMTEIGQLYHNKLFGYKDKKGNTYPGIIIEKQTLQQRNSVFNSRALRPIVRRYC